MSERWGKHNIIVCLREYMNDLWDQLNKMRREGVDTVYVYTTGLYVTQMYEYLNAIKQAKIENLVLHFRGPVSTEHTKFIDDARRTRITNVECKFLEDDTDY